MIKIIQIDEIQLYNWRAFKMYKWGFFLEPNDMALLAINHRFITVLRIGAGYNTYTRLGVNQTGGNCWCTNWLGCILSNTNMGG